MNSLSQFELVGTSKDNGFPVVQVTLTAEMVTDKGYTHFNRDLAKFLRPYKDQGMVNIIILADNPKTTPPSLAEISKATRTREGRFLEEILRQIVLVGFQSTLIKVVTKFITHTTGVKMVTVDTLDDAYTVLDIMPAKLEPQP